MHLLIEMATLHGLMIRLLSFRITRTTMLSCFYGYDYSSLFKANEGNKSRAVTASLCCVLSSACKCPQLKRFAVNTSHTQRTLN